MRIILTTLNAKYIHSSLALRYLKAYSQREFSDIEIVEYSIKEPIMNMLTDLYTKNPDVIGFSCYIWNIEETISLIKLIKKVIPRVKVVVGGPEVSYDISYWLYRVKEIDFIVYGEGEATFHHLLKRLDEGNHIEDVKGIAFLNHGEVCIAPPQEKVELSTLPSPYDDEEDVAQLKDRIVYFEASRGCPFSCAYCMSSLETKVRYFELDRIKNDLLKLINSGVKTIKFVDRTFNIHKKFALDIFQFLIDYHKETVFQFEITADIMKPDVLQFLVDNAPKGIFRFEIGVQSTNENTNSLINRKQNFEKLSYTVRKLKEKGNIEQHLDLIAGLPEENYESFRKTFNDVFALHPEELQLGFLKILRGTQMWQEASLYDYSYMENAPYEILQNNVLSFNDVVRIKRVEDVLEKYWNAHRMNLTMEYLIKSEFETAFDFFQEFGDYWETKGWNRVGHQLESLFERLYEFLVYRETKDINLIMGLMKLDYFMNFQYKPRKTWWDFSLSKKEQSEYYKDLVAHPLHVSNEFENLRLDDRNIHKHVMIEVIPFDLDKYLSEGVIGHETTLMIIYYQPPSEPKVFIKKI